MMHHINCMYTNADTLRNKMTEFEIRLKTVEGTVDEIHVITINEVNSKMNILVLIHVNYSYSDFATTSLVTWCH